jgi:hypothetical protein
MKPEKNPGEFVTVAAFNHQVDAEKLKAHLIDEGLAARVHDETRIQKYWFHAEPKAGIQVQTPKVSLEDVKLVMNEPKSARFLKRAIRCPSCASFRVQYPDLTRKNLLPTLLMQALVLLHLSQHKYYCEDCHYSWLEKPKKSHRRKVVRSAM